MATTNVWGRRQWWPLQPATALVTFHFDARDTLKSYDLVAATGPGSQP